MTIEMENSENKWACFDHFEFELLAEVRRVKNDFEDMVFRMKLTIDGSMDVLDIKYYHVLTNAQTLWKNAVLYFKNNEKNETNLKICQISEKHENLSVQFVYSLIIQEMRTNLDYGEGKFTNHTQAQQQWR